MALAIGQVNTRTLNVAEGSHMAVFVDIAGDTSYPTNGSALTPAQLGFSELHFLIAAQEPATGFSAFYDYVNQKLKVFTAAGAEVTNATNLSTKTWRVYALGTGFATLGLK